MSAIQTVDPSNTLAVLKAAEEWLSDESHWTQGKYWQNAEGRGLWISGERDQVTSTCLDGALGYVCGRVTAPPHVVRALRPMFFGDNLAFVNDNYGYDRIMAGLRKAIEVLETSA